MSQPGKEVGAAATLLGWSQMRGVTRGHTLSPWKPGLLIVGDNFGSFPP
jgi:hypothetical protein